MKMEVSFLSLILGKFDKNVKNKYRVCFCIARDHKRMYTKVECLSMRDLKKEHKRGIRYEGII